MNPLSRQLAELKLALQELESAVQQPRDERFGIEQVLDRFPEVLTLFYRVLREVLRTHGDTVESMDEAFIKAHNRGWLKGDMALWIRLLSDFQTVSSATSDEQRSRAMAQDVRAGSWMFWETYELLTARFRWQTQVQPAKALAVPPRQNYVSSRL